MRLLKQAVSRRTGPLPGFTPVAVAGLDSFFLQRPAAASRLTPGLSDDAIFSSELTLAL